MKIKAHVLNFSIKASNLKPKFIRNRKATYFSYNEARDCKKLNNEEKKVKRQEMRNRCEKEGPHTESGLDHEQFH